MKSECFAMLRAIGLAGTLLLGACANQPAEESPPVEAPALLSVLAYYQSLQRMPIADMARERAAYSAPPAVPGNQLRLAMLLGHPRGPRELGRALGLLDSLLKSSDAAALPLQALARVLADNFSERLKLDGQLDKQGAQLSESQHKAAELQEKLDGLADIERTLPARTRSVRPAKATGIK